MTNITTNLVSQRIGVAYIRESTEEQDKGYSPENQLTQMKEYAKRENIEIIAVYKDLQSGKSAYNRAGFQEMITAAAEKKFNVVLVFHSSRFARNVSEAKKFKNHLRTKLKIDVLSVTQNFGDWDDPGSFLNESINEVFDEYTSKNISFWVKTNLSAKRNKGKQLGNPPLGYYKKIVGEDKEKKKKLFSSKWFIDEKGKMIVSKIYEIYITRGYSIADIANKLNKEGHKTNNNLPFTYDSVRHILQNKVYTGQVYSPRNNYPDLISTNHEGFITKDIFEKAQQVRKDRSKSQGRPTAQHRFYLLQGLVYCYRCKKYILDEVNVLKNRLVPKMYSHTYPKLKSKKKKSKIIPANFTKNLKTVRTPSNVIK